MRVLLIEDDENKREQLAAFVGSVLAPEVIAIARSMNSGLRSLIAGSYGLVLLDMTMPTFDIGPDEDGGRPQAYAGREILRQMDRRGLRTPVIVVTQFDRFGEGTDTTDLTELDAQLKRDHPNTYRGVVYYNVSLTGWREGLLNLIRGVTNGIAPSSQPAASQMVEEEKA